MADNTTKKKSSAPKKEAAAATYTVDEVQKLIDAAVEKVRAEMQPQRIYQTVSEEFVTVMFLDEVSPENIVIIPGYGSLRPNSTLDIPKKEFGGQFMTNLVRKLIEKRQLIVCSGLTEDERIRYNCDYKEGEILDERRFDRLLDLPTDDLCGVFKTLCDAHRKFVCRRIITAKENGDNRVSLEKVRAVNNISKDRDPDGMLRKVIEQYGKELV